MNFVIRIPLNTTTEQSGRLQALQTAFAQVCNAISPTVQQTRCWNRVALHHLVYKSLRARFPALGSQMVCNAIYSVSRTSRLVFQHPNSPYNVVRLGAKPLPLLRFYESCPVYFDRHTLSVKAGQLSMYTLDGRMRFQLALQPADEAAFHDMKLQEIILSRPPEGAFQLMFTFVDPLQAESNTSSTEGPDLALAKSDPQMLDQSEPVVGLETAIPEYVMVEEAV